MGAYTSVPQCREHYGIAVDCTVVYASDNKTVISVGGNRPGDFNPDPDIAGIGILGAFVVITGFALIIAFLHVLWHYAKLTKLKKRITAEEKENKRWQLSIGGFFEMLIISCSDQQIFTGAAYAITMRFAKACSISAYHYNVIANMLLITCATHLLTLLVSKHYWEHPWVAGIRTVATGLLYLATGIYLSTQATPGSELAFPTAVPKDDEKWSTLLLPAACFQGSAEQFANTLQQSFHGAGLFKVGDRITGWTPFVILVLYYVLANIVTLGRVVRAGRENGGKREKFCKWLVDMIGQKKLKWVNRIGGQIYGVYLLAGLVISGYTMASSSEYIEMLRRWVDRSGWIQLYNGTNPENDPKSFGQLVPLLMMTLTVFTFLQMLSEAITIRKLKNNHSDELEDVRQEFEDQLEDARTSSDKAQGSGMGNGKRPEVHEKEAFSRPSEASGSQAYGMNSQTPLPPAPMYTMFANPSSSSSAPFFVYAAPPTGSPMATPDWASMTPQQGTPMHFIIPAQFVAGAFPMMTPGNGGAPSPPGFPWNSPTPFGPGPAPASSEPGPSKRSPADDVSSSPEASTKAEPEITTKDTKSTPVVSVYDVNPTPPPPSRSSTVPIPKSDPSDNEKLAPHPANLRRADSEFTLIGQPSSSLDAGAPTGQPMPAQGPSGVAADPNTLSYFPAVAESSAEEEGQEAERRAGEGNTAGGTGFEVGKAM
ncbi:uncharacterized protein B0T23DRAFT_442553 [Neurospora hispaniola]|uniref:Uncharacterized protein n=1 Tax=Neurospora hispaniola TaxID=588809 RepID=A0AAJ0MRS5_9PEZI|nr:hypothetical protein B0T23DRAFT_442553 [Neurospora hispaniola]